VRSIAVDLMPGTWQIILGTVLLLTILFLPGGLGSVVTVGRRRLGIKTP
jgi:branched-chain amino acid transport system permease protein